MIKLSNIHEAELLLNKYKGSTNKKYTLDNIRQLMEYIGNPQNKLKVIHVAGTSGKTSTCYYVASLLKSAGYKVGLTISPHIEKISERAQIDMGLLSDDQYCELLNEFLGLVDNSGVRLTYFEILVAFAYWVFAKLSVDYAVVEVGLGGLLDGTNIVDSKNKICLITDIGLDHVEILGNNLTDIAWQKSGIIHHGNVVFMNHQTKEVEAIVKNTCDQVGAKLNFSKNNHQYSWVPCFQNRNINLAITVCDFILTKNNRQLLNTEQIIYSSKILIPARSEVLKIDNKKVIIDGSHNDQKIGALVQSIKQMYPNTKTTILASFGNNKKSSVKKSLRLLHNISDEIIFTRFNIAQDENRTAISEDVLSTLANDIGFTQIAKDNDPFKALDILMSHRSDIYLITGSFYLVSQIRPILMYRRNA